MQRYATRQQCLPTTGLGGELQGEQKFNGCTFRVGDWRELKATKGG